ncbi:MAG: hypothetical protein JST40_11400 [Armatimonadetes bacterium]|nr:hypothetical protein [Armatimonadota bacterium]
MLDPLALLQRSDKWFLAGGKGALYAPPFPQHLLSPGFWDECFFADIRLEHLFTVLFLDRRGRGCRAETRYLGGTPAGHVLEHRVGDSLLRETRAVLECQAWVSRFELLSGPEVDLVVWSMPGIRPQEQGAPHQTVSEALIEENGVAYLWETKWPVELAPDRSATESESAEGSSSYGDPLRLGVMVGADGSRLGAHISVAEKHDPSPIYETSMLPELYHAGELSNGARFDPDYAGWLHLYQAYRLESGTPLQVAAAVGLSESQTKDRLASALIRNGVEESEQRWREYLGSVPHFVCENRYLQAAYWNRWAGIRLNTVDEPELPMSRGPRPENPELTSSFGPFVTEGIGFFRNFITYSSQAMLREVSWMRSPDLAIGILDNLARAQQKGGHIPGHNYSCRPPRDFYHADFGTGMLQMSRLHLGSVTADHVQMLKAYAEYYDSRRDYRGTGMIEIYDQNETGQEYMTRYQVASETADQWDQFRLGGVDACVIHNAVCNALSTLDEESGHFYGGLSAFPMAALVTASYDPEARFFCDVLPDGRKSPARPATGFYPFMAPGFPMLLERPGPSALLEVLDRWLLNEQEFWLASGFPATAQSDSGFHADPTWRGHRMNCPWNGRSWPMVNSHLVDGLANAARWLDPELRFRAGEALMKAVMLMFHDGDPSRPNSYEHYNPVSGEAAIYRGYDDYMHSWIVDLVLRHVVGVQLDDEDGGHRVTQGLVLDPLPTDADFECTGIPFRGQSLSVARRGEQLSWELG